MATIFVSHSARDRDLVSFFNTCRGAASVGLVWEEIEKMIDGHVSANKIRMDIEQSNAVFVILSTSVETIPHTRDWVVGESALANKKEVWVFERISELGQISVVTPFVRHYVLYEPVDAWIKYMRNIIESYDDSHVLPTAVLGGGFGALSGKPELAIAGALAGAVFANVVSRNAPQGVQITCFQCRSSYRVHLPRQWTNFRCPVCNTALRLESGVDNA